MTHAASIQPPATGYRPPSLYRIFVSSTGKDLVEHRRAVGLALQADGHQLEMMEDFGARAQTPTAASVDIVAGCDLLVGIYAWRYGTVPRGSRRSITEQELDKALELDIPCLLFLIDENDRSLREFADEETAGERLKDLKHRIRTLRVVEEFSDPQELAVKVRKAVRQEAARGFEPTEARPRGAQRVLLTDVEKSAAAYLDERVHDGRLMALGLASRSDWVDHRQGQDVGGDQPLAAGTRIFEAFDRARGRLLLLGSSGAGKSTALTDLARGAADRALRDRCQPMPVKVELAGWPGGPKLERWLIAEISEKYGFDKRRVGSWLAEDALLLLLDGLDDVAAERRRACVEAINAFRLRHQEARVVVTCRTLEYWPEITPLYLRDAIVLQPLTPEQIDDYLANADGDLSGLRRAFDTDPDLLQLARRPVMLYFMARGYTEGRGQGLRAGEMSREQRREHLLDAYVDASLTKPKDRSHTARSLATGLAWLARRLRQHGRRSFFLVDLQPSWLPRGERWIYALATRLTAGLLLGCLWMSSFHILLGASLGIAAGVVDAAAFLRPRPARTPPRKRDAAYYCLTLAICTWMALALASELVPEDPLYGALIAAIFCSFFCLRGAHRHVTDDLRAALHPGFSTSGFLWGALPGLVFALWVLVSRPALRATWVLGGAAALVLGVILGLLAASDRRSRINERRNRLGLALLGVLLGILSLVVLKVLIELLVQANSGAGRSQRSYVDLGPFLVVVTLVWGGSHLMRYRHGAHLLRRNRLAAWLRTSVINGLVVLVLGVGIELAFDVAFEGWLQALESYRPYTGLCQIAFLVLLATGGLDVLQHYILRLLLYCRGRMPWRYGGFLDCAVSNGLLSRDVDGSYVFFHDLLLDHFAEQPPAEHRSAASTRDSAPG